ncbi:MAG TPA: hypothetical protein VMW15_02330 [Terracidiphilus sp.]|nr:hypothetical protein [Terracidiphilus sp.]
MTHDPLSAIERREFLKLAGAVSAVSLTQGALAQTEQRFSIEIDAADPVASGAPVRWAADQLGAALKEKGAVVVDADHVGGADFRVIVAGAGSPLAKGFSQADAELGGAESLRLMPGKRDGAQAILVSGSDERGFVYALLELAERVRFESNPASALHLTRTLEEKPANEVRSVGRYFCSEAEDPAWYYDKDFWRGYLDMLATCRFNQFCLAYGLEYDFPKGVTGDYFHFPYPYLVEVPGYSGVRVVELASPDGTVLATPRPLSAEEREKNFDILRFVAAETAARGLQFQLGLWTHAYAWTDSPDAHHRIEGLTPETHAAYCRDALAIILKECPQIQGLTLRVHGESGIPEGSYPFWKTLFEAVTSCGRRVEIDMHAKGVNQTMIDMAADTGMPVKLGAKYSAEHQSLGYQQADIRALEIPKTGHEGEGPFSLSSGTRSFTRYGYADFLREGVRYKVLFRLWPGTQRHLLSADPEMAAAYSRTSHFCGAVGLDLMEPLTFKGREGSGRPGGRCAYADATLKPRYDWEKFEYYYRVWGRKLYDPDADAEIWRRWLRASFGPAELPVETAVANASRILALLTSAHLPSAANHSFWPEIYTNMPTVIGSEPAPYTDTPEPRCFATVSPLDPQIFSTIAEHVSDLLAGHANAKYSPIEVAQWMEDFAAASRSALAEARRKATTPSSPEFRRIEADVLIQAGLGEFFAAKMRSAALYEIFEQTANERAGSLALAQYQRARAAWAGLAAGAGGVYRDDIAYGRIMMRRGHWSDRLAAIDTDIDALAKKREAVRLGSWAGLAVPAIAQNVAKAIAAAVGRPRRPAVKCEHNPPLDFHPGAPLDLTLKTAHAGGLESIQLHYRHVNQGERWLQMEMEAGHGGFAAAIAGDYTQSAYPLEYYFELRGRGGAAWLYPAFNSTLSNQPYYAIANRSA